MVIKFFGFVCNFYHSTHQCAFSRRPVLLQRKYIQNRGDVERWLRLRVHLWERTDWTVQVLQQVTEYIGCLPTRETCFMLIWLILFQTVYTAGNWVAYLYREWVLCSCKFCPFTAIQQMTEYLHSRPILCVCEFDFLPEIEQTWVSVKGHIFCDCFESIRF